MVSYGGTLSMHRGPMRRLIVLLILLTPVLTLAATHSGLAPRTGMLLVATEQIQDPRFQESVILITRHDRQGTVGLILNRHLGKLPNELKSCLQTQPNGIFWGGPVAPLQVNALLFGGDKTPGRPLTEGLKIVSGDQLGELLHYNPLEHCELRVYLGYASWAPSQLASEISRDDWSVMPLDVTKLKRLAPENLWQELVLTTPSPWI